MFKREGESLAWAALITCRHWWRVQCPLCQRLVYHCLHMQVEKNEKKKAWISVGLKLSGVLHGWLDHWTRLPNYHFGVKWHKRHPKHSHAIVTGLGSGYPLWFKNFAVPFLPLDPLHTYVDTVDAVRVISVRTWSKPPPSPLTLKHKFHVKKIARIKKDGESLGTRLSSCHRPVIAWNLHLRVWIKSVLEIKLISRIEAFLICMYSNLWVNFKVWQLSIKIINLVVAVCDSCNPNGGNCTAPGVCRYVHSFYNHYSISKIILWKNV